MRIPIKVLDDIWECSEWRVVDIVTQLDRLVFVMMEDARSHGVKQAEVAEYFAELLSETIEYVASHRESDAQQAERQRRTLEKLSKGKLSNIGRPKLKTSQKRKEKV